MHEHDPTSIEEQLTRIGQFVPTPQRTTQAVARTRAALAGLRSGAGRRSRLRWALMPAGIAASVVLLVLLLSLPNTPLSAAEALNEIERVTQEYQGWVHMTALHEDGDPGKTPGYLLHYNTVDWRQASVNTKNGIRMVTFKDTLNQADMYYRSDLNEIHIADLFPGFGDHSAHSFSEMPTSIANRTARMRRAFQSVENFEISRSTVGTLQRFEINWSSKSRPDRPANETPRSIVYWVDPQTKLIQRVEAYGSVSVVTYGEPELATIYDLDVPRDATVIDDRPTGAVRDILDRLDERIQQGYGDGISVLTTEVASGADASELKPHLLDVFARRGAMFLWCQYKIENGAHAGARTIPEPRNWPDLTTAQVVALMRRHRPRQATFCDGTWGWMLNDSRPEGYFIDLLVRDGSVNWRHDMTRPGRLASRKAAFDVAARIWPGRYRLRMFEPMHRAELLEPDDRSRHRSLRITKTPRRPTSWAKAITTYVIDPTRNDVPIRTSGLSNRPDTGPGGEASMTKQTQWTEHAQLRNGAWYPSRWRDTVEDHDRGTTRISESRLRIDPGAILDEAWFQRPSTRFGVDSAQLSPPSTQPTKESATTAPGGVNGE
jgi:hypothetical protein